MWRRIALAIALALAGPPSTATAAAARRVRCRDGTVLMTRRAGACRYHGGVARVVRPPGRSRQGRVALCRDGTLTNRRYNVCRDHGGVKRWL